jgi:hypothetical protein
MITLELENYIKQSRAQGMSDDQIRQNLLSGGWNKVDLDQALSEHHAPLATNHTTQKSYKKLVITILIILSLPILLALGIYGAFVYMAMQNTTTGTILQNNKVPSGTGCDSAIIIPKPTLPSGWSSDLPIYPNSILKVSYEMNETTGGIQMGYCTNDNVDMVAEYFLKQNTIWNLRKLAPIDVGIQYISLLGSEGNKTLKIEISGENGKETTIMETYYPNPTAPVSVKINCDKYYNIPFFGPCLISPDGKLAVAGTREGLRIIDAVGNITTLSKLQDDRAVLWFSDSQRILGFTGYFNQGGCEGCVTISRPLQDSRKITIWDISSKTHIANIGVQTPPWSYDMEWITPDHTAYIYAVDKNGSEGDNFYYVLNLDNNSISGPTKNPKLR